MNKDPYINIIEGMNSPPCENKILECHVWKELQEISKIDNGDVKFQAKKEALKSYYCDTCYDYFYDKLKNETYGEE